MLPTLPNIWTCGMKGGEINFKIHLDENLMVLWIRMTNAENT
jgi:hypothetical protein